MSVQDEPYIACNLLPADGIECCSGLAAGCRLPTLSPGCLRFVREKGVVSVAGGAVQCIAAFGKCLPQKAMGEWKDVCNNILNAV